jgi:hypothetical protein
MTIEELIEELKLHSSSCNVYLTSGEYEDYIITDIRRSYDSVVIKITPLFDEEESEFTDEDCETGSSKHE